jgi:hypothetical protein
MIATSADNRNPDENLSFRSPVQSSSPHGFKFPGADLVQSIPVLTAFSTLIYVLRFQDYCTTNNHSNWSFFSSEPRECNLYKRYRKQVHDAYWRMIKLHDITKYDQNQAVQIVRIVKTSEMDQYTTNRKLGRISADPISAYL